MATPEQVTQIITIMQQQMTLLQGQRTGGGDAGNANRRSRKPDRPEINAGIDDREWSLFKDTWSRYKTMIGLSGTGDNTAEIRMELRAACSTEVNRMLFEFVGPTTLNVCSEQELLDHIKSVAVKETHHEVHQMTFHSMIQQEGETITHFVARLKAQAFLCKFETTCSCVPPTAVSYADKMVAQRLLAGLNNVEHKRKILAEAATLTTLDAKIKRLQLLETTEESAGILHNTPPVKPSEAGAARSQYKKMQRGAVVKSDGDNESTEEKCRGCGKSSHPGGKSLARSNCPAFKKKCGNCDKKGHFARVCEQPSTALSHDAEEETEQLDNIASAASVSFAFAGQTSEDFRLRGAPSTGT